MKAERLTDSVAYHGEGAVWFDGWNGLRWVDMLAGDILHLDEDTGQITRQHIGSDVAAMVRPRRDGGFVVATHREFAVWDDEGHELWRTPALWERGMRFNEGSCDPQGRMLCGTIDDSRAEGSAEIWRLGRDGLAERIMTGVTISNGLGYSSDGDRAYYVDSRTRRVDLFDTAEGELANRRPFAAIEEGAGSPDGLCVDVDDGIWVALYNGHAARHYDATGALDAVVEVPDAARVTSCALGGPAGTTLYLTTSREGLAADEEPAAGSIYRAEVGTPGLPVRTADISEPTNERSPS